MPISITINGIDALKGELLELPAALEKTVILQMSQIAYDKMQEGANVHNRSGKLFDSIYNRSTDKGREVGHDTQMAPYAPFVLFGTQPHKIVPRDKKALRWAKGGQFFFAKSVNHPGYIGDDYMQVAADESIRQFAAIVDKALKEQLK